MITDYPFPSDTFIRIVLAYVYCMRTLSLKYITLALFIMLSGQPFDAKQKGTSNNYLVNHSSIYNCSNIDRKVGINFLLWLNDESKLYHMSHMTLKLICHIKGVYDSLTYWDVITIAQNPYQDMLL